MSSPNRPLLADLQAEIRSLAADLQEMLRLRWELARLEIEADVKHLKRLAFLLVAAAIMALTSLPLLITCGAEALDGRWGIARIYWLLLFGLGLLLIALISALGGWIWFRRHFIGLQETIEEMREDVEWLKEGRIRDKG